MSMIRKAFIITAIAIISSAAAAAYADTVYLKNGGSVSGIIDKEDEGSIEVNIGSGTVTFKRSQIDRIEKSDAKESGRLAEKWQEYKEEMTLKEEEYKEARDNRFKSAYENWMEEEAQKKSIASSGAKEIKIARSPAGKDIVVEVLLNNSVKANLILDTGASLIALSRRVGEELGVDLSDTKKDIMEMHLADGKRTLAKAVILNSVKIDDIEVKLVRAAVILDQETVPYSMDGLLGMSFLSKFNIKVDLKNMKMSLDRITE